MLLLFGAVVFFGAPYLPTMSPQVQAAFALLRLKPGQTVLELGCGDGKVLLAAAREGYKAIGFEINPVLVLVALWKTRKYRSMVTVRWANFWRTPWPPADGVFVFLLDKYMQRLDERMKVYKKPLVSVAFTVPGKAVAAEKNAVFLYRY